MSEIKADSLFSFRVQTPSGLLARRDIELKIFNNLYSQTDFFDASGSREDEGSRKSWYTGLFRIQYGISRRLEAGLDMNYRRVHYGSSEESALMIFVNDKDSVQRSGISRVGVNLRWQVFPSISNFSARISFLRSVLSVSNKTPVEPFLDGDSDIAALELLFDKNLSKDFWIYTSLNNQIEFARSGGETFRSPLSLIGSYRGFEFLSPYLMTELSPVWAKSGFSSYYLQIGPGLKLFPKDDLELEILYSNFILGKNAGAGQTCNLGLRKVF